MPTEAASLVTVRFWKRGSVGLGMGTASAWPKAGATLAPAQRTARERLRGRWDIELLLLRGVKHGARRLAGCSRWEELIDGLNFTGEPGLIEWIAREIQTV